LRRSREIGAYLGFVPHRYPSGDFDYTGSVSKCGDRPTIGAGEPGCRVRAGEAVCSRLPGIRPIAFGHLGDGSIHFNLTQPEGMGHGQGWLSGALAGAQRHRVHGVVRELRGSISAERGSA
jgi:FAD/FMN-containing dehydrogenase